MACSCPFLSRGWVSHRPTDITSSLLRRGSVRATRGAARASVVRQAQEPAIRSSVPSRFAGTLRSHRLGQTNRSVGLPSADETQEHDGRLARGETVRRSGLHVQLEAGSRVELLTVRE